MITADELIKLFRLNNPKVVKDNLMASCPFASDNHASGKDTHRSFGINLDSLQWNCFSCNERGESVRSLAYKMKIMIPAGMMMDTLIDLDSIVKNKAKGIKGDYDSSLIKLACANTDMAAEILGKRGIAKSTIVNNHVGYNATTKSLVFPCVDMDGKLNGWIERNDIWDNRYGFRPYQVAREYLLFGMTRKVKTLYLVESTTDMLQLRSWKFWSVSTCGNRIFEQQAKMILNHVDEIVLVPQNDGPAGIWIDDYRKHLLGKLPSYLVTVRQPFKDVCTEGYDIEMFRDDEDKKVMLF